MVVRHTLIIHMIIELLINKVMLCTSPEMHQILTCFKNIFNMRL